jgi:hypothetical protein
VCVCCKEEVSVHGEEINLPWGGLLLLQHTVASSTPVLFSIESSVTVFGTQ